MAGEAQCCSGAGATGPEAGEFVVVMADPVTGEVDAFGPYPAASALDEVDRRRAELASEGLGEVVVLAVSLNRPA